MPIGFEPYPWKPPHWMTGWWAAETINWTLLPVLTVVFSLSSASDCTSQSPITASAYTALSNLLPSWPQRIKKKTAAPNYCRVLILHKKASSKASTVRKTRESHALEKFFQPPYVNERIKRFLLLVLRIWGPLTVKTYNLHL